MTATSVILVLNVGSSSVKFCFFEWGHDLPLHTQGQLAGIGSHPQLMVNGKIVQTFSKKHDQIEAVNAILEWINTTFPDITIKAIGHRIVHGGPGLTAPVKLTDKILKTLSRYIPLAPLHQPYSLLAVNTLAKRYPELVQIGCFDTAFHAQHDPILSCYALPANIREQGVRRYGFHGLSYEWIAYCLKNKHPDQFNKRVVVAHLGNGASLCAMQSGRSIDTTMGMTALDGLPMGTRCGSIDPGAVLYMLKQLKCTPDQVEHILSYESGLKGLSGISNDMQELLSHTSQEADFAVRFFAMMTAQHIARMAVSLNGIDTLVFTGGIGEHATFVRELILSHLQWLGPPETLVIKANEERLIAMHCQRFCTLNNLDIR